MTKSAAHGHEALEADALKGARSKRGVWPSIRSTTAAEETGPSCRPDGPWPVEMKMFCQPGAWPSTGCSSLQKGRRPTRISRMAAGFKPSATGERLAQHLGDAACRQAGIEPRFMLAGGSGDDAAGREGEQIVRVEADDDRPGARILPAHFEMDDLPALRMERNRHAKLLADGG